MRAVLDDRGMQSIERDHELEAPAGVCDVAVAEIRACPGRGGRYDGGSLQGE
jgi:hypothetical protein